MSGSLLPGEGLEHTPPLTLYVHLPWCIKKCPYCDFNSHQKPVGEDQEFLSLEARYLDALEVDCDLSVGLVWGRTVDAVFIGGGTPSLFSAKGIDRLLSLLRSRFLLRPQCEITLEANPGTFELERYEGFAKAGVNRLSIGVQSFNDDALQSLGRVHNAAQAQAAIAVARSCFESFNIDLMYGLPNQGLDGLKRELDQAFSFDPPHLSYYQLTLEPNTYFAKHPPSLPDDDAIAQMQEMIEVQTLARGLEHYEVSAYAKPGKRCQHNLNYWQFGDYLGLGAGAHGKLSFHDRIVRHQKYRQPETYMRHLLGTDTTTQASLASVSRDGMKNVRPVIPLNPEQSAFSLKGALEVERILKPDDLIFEFFLNTLRLKEGVPTASFGQRTGLGLGRLNTAISEACAKGLLDEKFQLFKATDLGFRFLNDLQMLFLPNS